MRTETDSMNIEDRWLPEVITEARQACATGATRTGSPRIGQADGLLKLDTNFARTWRERIDAACTELADAPEFLKDYVLSFVISRWLEDIEEEIAAIFRGRVKPLVSRTAVELVVENIVHEHVRGRLADESGPATATEYPLAMAL